ncbi:MAG: Amphi-Trp domain [Pseudomonadota bacterium]|jgi:amphi-Trp domain-containing protein
MKKKKLQYKELRSLDSAIEQLQALVDGLRTGALSLERGELQLQLKPGAVLDFALCAERDGVQERFELSLEWRRQDLTMGSTGRSSGGSAALTRPQSMVVPAAARGLALQAEAERLFEEDDSDPPLSSDDDDTLGSDDVLASGDLLDIEELFIADEPTVAPAAVDAVEVPLRSSVAATSSAPGPLAQDGSDDEAVTVRHSSPPAGQPSAARRSLLPDARWFQELYAAARALDADGQLRLDARRFAASLVDAGLEPALQEELYSLARQADDERREQLFKEPRISELIANTLSGAA